jgi:hypothetical protein
VQDVPMRTGPEQYLSRRGPRPRPFLRTAQLNAVGWSALAGVCLVAGVLTALTLRATGWHPALRGAVGAVGVLAALVVADRRKWGRMETGFSFTDDAVELRRVGNRLIAQGLPVRVDEEQWGPRLRYRHRDARRVHAALAELGIVTP